MTGDISFLRTVFCLYIPGSAMYSGSILRQERLNVKAGNSVVKATRHKTLAHKRLRQIFNPEIY